MSAHKRLRQNKDSIVFVYNDKEYTVSTRCWEYGDKLNRRLIDDKTKKFVKNVIDQSIKSKGNLRYLQLSTDFDEEGYKQFAVTLNKRQVKYFADVTDGKENPEKPPAKIRIRSKNQASEPDYDKGVVEETSAFFNKIIEKDDFTYLMGDFTEEEGLWFQFDVPIEKLPEIMEDQ